MKFFRSIRWRLQLWHGLLLALALSGLGATAWRLQRATLFQGVDQELERRVAVVGRMLDPEGNPAGRGPRERPQHENRPTTPPNIRLPERDQELFGGTRGADFFYVAWSPDGRELGASASAPKEVPRPQRAGPSRATRSRGTSREHYRFSPDGACILVGKDLREDLADLRRFGWLLAAAGGAVFACGLAGGWWISGRALRPIADIGATAARIASGDLSRRIPAADKGSELDELARVLNQTFARLQTSFALQAQFSADASHELRKPVAVVLNQTQSALAKERSPAEYRESLEACQRAAQRMRRLIDSLLALARIESGDGGARETCHLDRIARETLEQLRPLAEQKKIALAAELEPATCTGDPEQLARVTSNLLGNAIRHNREGGRAWLKVAGEGDEIVLAVRDDGLGIAPADLPHLFERFYRGEKSRSSAEGSMGLGLAIARAIVESHGGTIEAASAPGQGSTFTVRLPAR